MVEPHGIQFLNPRDRQYCVYPDGNVGPVDNNHPYVLSFDAFNPKQLTGSELSRRYKRADVAASARQTTQLFKEEALEILKYIDLSYHYDAYTGSPNGYIARKVKDFLPTTRPLEELTSAALIHEFVENYAGKLAMDKSAAARCEELISKHKDRAEQYGDVEAAGKIIYHTFETRSREIRADMGGLATRLRTLFGTEENAAALRKDAEERNAYIQDARETIATFPKPITQIAAYNALNLYLTPNVQEDNAVNSKKERTVQGFADSQRNMIVSPSYPAVLLEELVHYCDRVLAQGKTHIRDKSKIKAYTSNPAAEHAAETESIPYRKILVEARDEYLKTHTSAQQYADTSTAGFIFNKSALWNYPEASRSTEHLANIIVMQAELHSPDSQLRRLLHIAPGEEDAYLKQRLPLTCALAEDFTHECEKEVSRMKAGGKPVYAPNQFPQSQHQFLLS